MKTYDLNWAESGSAVCQERRSRFDSCYERADDLRSYLVRRLPSSDVEDALSDVFVVAWRRIDDVPADDPVPWLFAVARHVVANHYRAQRRQRRLVEKVRSAHVNDDQTNSNPEINLFTAAEAARVLEAIATLPTAEQETMVLLTRHRLSRAEVAELHGVSVNAVDQRVSRSYRRLRSLLAAVVVLAGLAGLVAANQFDKMSEETTSVDSVDHIDLVELADLYMTARSTHDSATAMSLLADDVVINDYPAVDGIGEIEGQFRFHEIVGETFLDWSCAPIDHLSGDPATGEGRIRCRYTAAATPTIRRDLEPLQGDIELRFVKGLIVELTTIPESADRYRFTVIDPVAFNSKISSLADLTRTLRYDDMNSRTPLLDNESLAQIAERARSIGWLDPAE